MIVTLLTLLIQMYSWAGSCSLSVIGGVPKSNNPYTKIEINSTQADTIGHYYINGSHTKLISEFTVHESSGLAKRLSSLFEAHPNPTKPNQVNFSTQIEVVIVDHFQQVKGLAESPNSTVERYQDPMLILDIDIHANFKRVYFLSKTLDSSLALRMPLPKTVFQAPAQKIVVKKYASPSFHSLLPETNRIFIGGLISISAEPPEGFFAASTTAEFESKGWKPVSADEADIWIYRTADSRPESYFKFQFPSLDRPSATNYSRKFKIATGLGPMNDSSSSGGSEADLLWLGDEQEGSLEEYLRFIKQPDFKLEGLKQFNGFTQKLTPRSVWVGNIAVTHGLTQKGFNQLTTDVKTYRKVFSREYDKSLLELFQHSEADAQNESYLLATSRGCSQGCSLCCSGGLSEFQFFTADRMIKELEKIADDAKVTESNKKVNIFFVDSNFNNNPSRIIEFAKRYKESSLFGRFNFYIRHNTVNGFLKAKVGSENKLPNEDLIQAYHTLGIHEIFMGIDSYDDASTFTLKTHRNKVAKGAENAKPIYSVTELKLLIESFNSKGMYTKGFYLKNNPWVSDFDRIDSYYHLLEIWLNNPRFSIDTRNEDVNKLKPFSGSPIGAVSAQLGGLDDGYRYVAKTPLGEIDEIMHFKGLGAPRETPHQERIAINEWLVDMGKIKRSVIILLDSPDHSQHEYAHKILLKLSEKESELLSQLKREKSNASLNELITSTESFLKKYPAGTTLQSDVQKNEFIKSSQSLVDGLKQQYRASDRDQSVGYDSSLSGLDSRSKHTIKDLRAYLTSNLGSETLHAIQNGSTEFRIVLGDGKDALAWVHSDGWKNIKIIEKKEGFHQVYSAEKGTQKVYFIVRVNGEDRKIHIQSLLKLANLPHERLRTVGEHHSWRSDYVKTFQSLGEKPDAVFYGFPMSVLGAILLENKLGNILHIKKYYALKKERHSTPNIATESDLKNIFMFKVERADGKKIRIFNSLYGDLSRDLLLALNDIGANNIIFAGTAGALTSQFHVGQVVNPLEIKYERISTPNLETEEWLQNRIRAGVSVIDVELGYWLDVAKLNPKIKLQSYLMVSDVLSGEHSKDMTEWKSSDGNAITPVIIQSLRRALGDEPRSSFKIKKMERVHLIRH